MKGHRWLILAASLVASALQAQVSDTTSKTKTAAKQAVADSLARKAGSATTRESGADKVAAGGSLTMVVRTHDGRRVERAFVTAVSVDTAIRPAVTRTTSTDASGYFRLDSLKKGRYEIRVDSTASPPVNEQFLVDGAVAASLVLPARLSDGEPSTRHTLWTLLCLLIYGATILIARWHRIARPVHAMIRSHLTALTTRLETEVDPALPQVAKLMAAVRALQTDEDKYAQGHRRFGEFFFFSRGRENATWAGIHEIERELAAVLAPPAQVESYLRWAEAELRQMTKPSATAIADAIVTALAAEPVDLVYRKALLGRGISLIYAARDASFATLMEWHNKASWLILAAITVIAFLSGAVGHSILFLAGAAGGYSSRLMRALKRDDVPLDYGASWTTLFLSPLFGALTGWFGIALITLAARPELNLLGPAFRLVDWYNPFGPITIGIAFLLGFSERLFDAVVGALENNAGVVRAAAAPAPAPAPLPTAGASASPVINEIVRQKRADGAVKDGLLVKGSGFVAASTATVNGTPRALEYQSAQAVLLALTPQDLARIDAGGDSEVSIANPGGAVSNTKNFV